MGELAIVFGLVDDGRLVSEAVGHIEFPKRWFTSLERNGFS